MCKGGGGEDKEPVELKRKDVSKLIYGSQSFHPDALCFNLARKRRKAVVNSADRNYYSFLKCEVSLEECLGGWVK